MATNTHKTQAPVQVYWFRLKFAAAIAAFATIGVSLLLGSSAASVPGDLNGNGTINSQDLGVLLGNWKKRTSTGDFDGNGVVDARDLSIFMRYWRQSGATAPTAPPTSVSTPTPVQTPTPVPTPAPVARTIKIMPLGDSSVAGTGSSNGGGWRSPLYNLITNTDKRKVDFVGSQVGGPATYDRDHEGHSGWMIGAGSFNELSTYAATWMNTYKPDIVILQAGVNDLRTGISASDTASRFDQMVSKIFAAVPNVKLIVGTPLRQTDNTTVTAKVRDFNSRLGAIAQKYSSQGLSLIHI